MFRLFKLGGKRVGLIFKVEPLIAATKGEVLEQYQVDMARVFIVNENGRGKYLIQEPNLDEKELEIYNLLMEKLYFSMKPIKHVKNPVKYVEDYIWTAAEESGIIKEVEKSFQKYKYFIARDAFGYGVINVPMLDEDVEEISCESYGRPVAVIHRRFTEFDWLDTNIVFKSEEELRSFVQRLANKVGKNVTTAIPFMDAMTTEGHRVALTFSSEVTLPGSSFDVRKFPREPLSIAHLIKLNTLTPLMVAYYWLLVEHKAFIMILGPMGSGKTTVLNGLATLIPPSLKVATVEDTPEIRLPHTHWQRFKTRKGYSITETKYDIDLFDLVVLSMRYRPDYLIVGETRGEEISALIQAVAIGHGGLTSFHANDPESALVRMSSPPLNVREAGQMLIWSFITMNRIRLPDGKVVRRAVRCTEVVPTVSGVELKELFSWNARTDTFEPDTSEEVVKRSNRLKEVMKIRGWTREDLIDELERRRHFLEGIVEDNKLSHPEFSAEIGRFYMERRQSI